MEKTTNIVYTPRLNPDLQVLLPREFKGRDESYWTLPTNSRPQEIWSTGKFLLVFEPPFYYHFEKYKVLNLDQHTSTPRLKSFHVR